MKKFEELKKMRNEIEIVLKSDVYKSWTGEKKPEKNLVQFVYDFLLPDEIELSPVKEQRKEIEKLLKYLKSENCYQFN